MTITSRTAMSRTALYKYIQSLHGGTGAAQCILIEGYISISEVFLYTESRLSSHQECMFTLMMCRLICYRSTLIMQLSGITSSSLLVLMESDSNPLTLHPCRETSTFSSFFNSQNTPHTLSLMCVCVCM